MVAAEGHGRTRSKAKTEHAVVPRSGKCSSPPQFSEGASVYFCGRPWPTGRSAFLPFDCLCAPRKTTDGHGAMQARNTKSCHDRGNAVSFLGFPKVLPCVSAAFRGR